MMKVDKIPETRGLSHIVKLLRLSPDPIKTDERYWFADEIESHTLSSLCVPRSEYDKLKQHADRLADSVSFLLPMAKAHAFHNDVGSNVQICKDATDELAEYRKETE